MAVNLSQLITKIKMRLGIYGITLPVENPDNLIKETIELFTIPTYSLYQPYYDSLHVDVNDLKVNDKFTNGIDNSRAYLLPEFPNRKLIDVVDVNYDVQATSSHAVYGQDSYIGLIGYDQATMMQRMMLTNMSSQISSQLYPRLSFNFIAPMTLVIYNLVNTSRVEIKLSFEHHKSLATLPMTCEKSFFDLALLDTQINFYQIAKHWDNIETVLGNINIKIDDWADAESKRQSLLEDWDNLYHLDRPDSIIYK